MPFSNDWTEDLKRSVLPRIEYEERAHIPLKTQGEALVVDLLYYPNCFFGLAKANDSNVTYVDENNCRIAVVGVSFRL
jgi:hypothetical protein